VSDQWEKRILTLFIIFRNGVLFVKPQVKVYEGMIVGENARAVDLDVPIKKKLSNMRTTSADEAMQLY
jgi:GTP-binding protein